MDSVSYTVKTAGKIADGVDAVHDMGKAAEAIVNSGKTLDNISDATEIVADVTKKAQPYYFSSNQSTYNLHCLHFQMGNSF